MLDARRDRRRAGRPRSGHAVRRRAPRRRWSARSPAVRSLHGGGAAPIGRDPQRAIGLAARHQARARRTARDRARDSRGRSRCASEIRSSSRRPAARRRALSPGASGNPVNRVCALRSATRPHSISIASASRSRADHTATPNRAALSSCREIGDRLGGNAGLAGRPAREARAQRGEQARQLRPASRPMTRLPAASASRRAPGHSQHDRARARRVIAARRSETEPSGQLGRVLLQARPDQQQRVGAQPRLVRRGQHHAGLAQHGEVAQQHIGVHVIDDRADPLGQRDRRARAGDVGAEAGDHRTSGSQQAVRPLRLAHARVRRACRRSTPWPFELPGSEASRGVQSSYLM